MEANSFFKENKDEVMRFYYNINILQIPNGHVGEIQEAIDELTKNGIPVSKKTILKYLVTKTRILSYIKTNGAELVELYSENNTKDLTAGALLPDWIIATSIIITLVSNAANIFSKIYSLLKPKTPQEVDMIKNHAEQIIQIKEVKDLTIIINSKNNQTA